MDDLRAPVFIAATVAESEFVERLLEDEGVDFEVRPEAFLGEMVGGACRQGILFEVPSDRAGGCRALFRERGLARGIVDPESDY